jgi:hypothetical protein
MSLFKSVVNKLKYQQDNFVPIEHYKLLSDAYEIIEEEKEALSLKLEAVTKDYNNLIDAHKECAATTTLKSFDKEVCSELFLSDNFSDLCLEINDKMNTSEEVSKQCKELSSNPTKFAQWVDKHIIYASEFTDFTTSVELKEKHGISEADSLREKIELQIVKVASVNKEIEAVQTGEYLNSFQSELIRLLKLKLSKNDSVTDIDETINEYSLAIRNPDYLDFSVLYSHRVYKDSTKCISISGIPLLVFLQCQLLGFFTCVLNNKFTEGKTYPLLESLDRLIKENADRIKSIN